MSQKTDEKPRLPAHEWLAVVFICGTFLLFTAVSLINDSNPSFQPSEDSYQLVNTIIEIEIQGAVKNPGIYQAKKGTPLKEILALAEPSPIANLNRLNLDGKITRRRKITIREYKRKRPKDVQISP